MEAEKRYSLLSESWRPQESPDIRGQEEPMVYAPGVPRANLCLKTGERGRRFSSRSHRELASPIIPSPRTQTPKEITGTSPWPIQSHAVAVLFAERSPGVSPSSFALCCPRQLCWLVLMSTSHKPESKERRGPSLRKHLQKIRLQASL